MKKYELSIDREIEFMIKYQLTADELFLMRLIFYAQEGHEEYLSNFFTQCKLGTKILELLKSLQDKEIINKSYKLPQEGAIFKPQDVEFNKLVLKSFMQHSEDMGMELFENYPAMTTINGKVYSLRNITKLYKNIDEMAWEYGKAIKFNPETHAHIMELLEYGKENDLISSGICDFIASRKWLDLEEMKEGEMGTFKTTELV